MSTKRQKIATRRLTRRGYTPTEIQAAIKNNRRTVKQMIAQRPVTTAPLGKLLAFDATSSAAPPATLDEPVVIEMVAEYEERPAIVGPVVIDHLDDDGIEPAERVSSWQLALANADEVIGTLQPSNTRHDPIFTLASASDEPAPIIDAVAGTTKLVAAVYVNRTTTVQRPVVQPRVTEPRWRTALLGGMVAAVIATIAMTMAMVVRLAKSDSKPVYATTMAMGPMEFKVDSPQPKNISAKSATDKNTKLAVNTTAAPATMPAHNNLPTGTLAAAPWCRLNPHAKKCSWSLKEAQALDSALRSGPLGNIRYGRGQHHYLELPKHAGHKAEIRRLAGNLSRVEVALKAAGLLPRVHVFTRWDQAVAIAYTAFVDRSHDTSYVDTALAKVVKSPHRLDRNTVDNDDIQVAGK